MGKPKPRPCKWCLEPFQRTLALYLLSPYCPRCVTERRRYRWLIGKDSAVGQSTREMPVITVEETTK